MSRIPNKYAAVTSDRQGWGTGGLAERVRKAGAKKQKNSKGFAEDQASALKNWETNRVGAYATEQSRQAKMRGGSSRVKF